VDVLQQVFAALPPGHDANVSTAHRVVILEEQDRTGGPPAHESRRLALRILEAPILIALPTQQDDFSTHPLCCKGHVVI